MVEVITGTDGNDSIRDNGSDKVVYAGAGDDFIVMFDTTRASHFDGGTGTDFLVLDNLYSNDGDACTINYTSSDNGKITGGLSNGVTFKNFEILTYHAPASSKTRYTINTTAATGGSNIYTGEGYDIITVGTGANTIDGGGGGNYLRIDNRLDTADTRIDFTNYQDQGKITGGSSNGTIFRNILSFSFYTGSGNDTIDISVAAGSSVYSGAGNDTIVGGMGTDLIDAGAGDDYIYSGTGGDTLDGGTGKDTLRSDNGNDTANITIDYTSLSSGRITGGYSNGTIFKNIESVSFDTGSGNDRIDISAATGNNTVNAGAGNDTIVGGMGNDTIDAGAGDDYIYSGGGADTLDGGTGKDTLRSDNGNDTANITIDYTSLSNGKITGGSSNGTIFKNIEAVTLATGAGNDRIDISAATGNSSITSGAGNDTIVGGMGNDTIDAGAGDDLIYTGGGADTLDGGTGKDTLRSDNGNDTANITIDYTSLSNGKMTGGSSNGTTFKNIESVSFYTGSGHDRINISAATGNNTVNAGGGSDTIVGGAGNDTIFGGADNDNISGGTGNNSIDAGAGDDYIDNGAGASTLDGGTGKDTLRSDNSNDTANTTIDYTSLSNGTITGGYSNGTIFKNIEAVTLLTGSGNDRIDISAANNSYILSGAGNDTIFGGMGNDNIDAGSGNDIINGGAGNNVLNGGAGNDILTGGVGRDIFVFSGDPLLSLMNAIGVDTITNFTVGTDNIRLSKSYFSLFAVNTRHSRTDIQFSTVITDDAAALSSSGIVYNSTNGNLFYNVDGSASGFGASGGQFAQLSAGLLLTANDFLIVA